MFDVETLNDLEKRLAELGGVITMTVRSPAADNYFFATLVRTVSVNGETITTLGKGDSPRLGDAITHACESVRNGGK